MTRAGVDADCADVRAQLADAFVALFPCGLVDGQPCPTWRSKADFVSARHSDFSPI
jgi:hypothetical protein